MKFEPALNTLLEALLIPKNKVELWCFLRDLLTEEELREFSRRLAVADMLRKKIPYTEIEQKTGMSSKTIARIAKFLNGNLGGYDLVLNHLHHHSDNTSPV